MSLVDIDKDGDDRARPIPPHFDSVPQGSKPSHGTHSVNYVSDATDTSAIAPALSGEFIIAQTGTITTSSQTFTAAGAGNFKTDGVVVASIAHGLPYTPTVIGFYGSAGTQYGMLPIPDYNAVGTNTATWFTFRCVADATNFYVVLHTLQVNTLSSITLAPLDIRYYLFRQILS